MTPRHEWAPVCFAGVFKGGLIRVFQITPTGVIESGNLPRIASPAAYVWIAFAREEFECALADIQAALQTLCGVQLVDLHVCDRLNQQYVDRNLELIRLSAAFRPLMQFLIGFGCYQGSTKR